MGHEQQPDQLLYHYPQVKPPRGLHPEFFADPAAALMPAEMSLRV